MYRGVCMKRNDVLKLLDERKIAYRYQEHPAVYTMEEMHALHLEGEKSVAKNLFLRDDKKREYYLVSIGTDDSVDLKTLRQIIGSRPLSFASEKDLKKLLKLEKGSVTPLGLLNDSERKVHFLADIRFQNRMIGIHPMENTATVWMKTEDLMDLLAEHGSPVQFIQIRQLL